MSVRFRCDRRPIYLCPAEQDSIFFFRCWAQTGAPGKMTDAENGQNRGEDAMSAETNPAPLKRTMSAGTIPPYTRHGSSLASLNTMDVFNRLPKKLDDNR